MKKGLTIGGLVASSLLGIIAVVLVVAGGLAGNSYGERIEFKNGELYYTENVSFVQAGELANFLEEQFGELENDKTFQLDREGEDLIVRMCAMSSTWETDELDSSYIALELMLQSQCFIDSNVKIQLCDERLTPRKTIDSTPLAADSGTQRLMSLLQQKN